MLDINNLKKYISPILGPLVLSACALSPQTISLNPKITMEETRSVSETVVTLDFLDVRKSNVIGYRGGVYDTAAISTEGDISGPVYNEIARVLDKLGFSVVTKGSSSGNRLVIELRQLSYKVQQKNIIWTIEVYAEVNAITMAGSRSISHSLEDRYTKDFPKSPSTVDNEKMINEIFSRLLQRVLQDESVISLLRG